LLFTNIKKRACSYLPWLAPQSSMSGKKRKRVGHDKRSQIEQQEVQLLQRIIAEQAPLPGTNPVNMHRDAASMVNAGDGGQMRSYASARKFDELPISRYTREALKAAHYVDLTAIQRAALPHALAGRDVLGAAKTGSGKTLAFLVPVRSTANFAASATQYVALQGTMYNCRGSFASCSSLSLCNDAMS
jgi:hypothetical protein